MGMHRVPDAPGRAAEDIEYVAGGYTVPRGDFSRHVYALLSIAVSNWSFWSESTSINVDGNDDMVWRSWSSQVVASIDILLPSNWPLFHPTQIHPDFQHWFRAAYEKARATLREDERRAQDQYRHEHWLKVLDLPR